MPWNYRETLARLATPTPAKMFRTGLYTRVSPNDRQTLPMKTGRSVRGVYRAATARRCKPAH